MSSRAQILAAVRRHLPESSPLPELQGPWIEYADPVAQFAAVLDMIGGRSFRVPDVAAMQAQLETLPQFAQSQRTLSLIPGIPSTGIELEAVADPHDLEDIDFAILPGEFGVAENAAIWVTDAGLKHRVVYFLCQHLALVIPADQIVNNLGEAYARIRIEGQRFGTFIAGPSKTADIEQSLVIGAHGPKSLTVFLVG
ncbi:MAG TPA: LUD domain-containing protein [Planctomycetaceae bacterium]|nr:LUD domain-containing protein [Planctomycetaceae bacterium]